MSLSFDQLAEAVTLATGQSVAGSLPVKVKLTTGSITEIAAIRLVKGDLILKPAQSTEADMLLIEL